MCIFLYIEYVYKIEKKLYYTLVLKIFYHYCPIKVG